MLEDEGLFGVSQDPRPISPPNPFEYLPKNPNVKLIDFKGMRVGKLYPNAPHHLLDLATVIGAEIAVPVGIRHTYGFQNGDERVKDWESWEDLLLDSALDMSMRFGFDFPHLIFPPTVEEIAEASSYELSALDEIRGYRPPRSSILTLPQPGQFTVTTFGTRGEGFSIRGRNELDSSVFILPVFHLPT